ncbi:MAG: helix-turn-helix domain-containing protein [Chitinophagaceae bacterium]|nr:helix-turn-helix domain-containing protein [Chitinophagaceae bacterium]
MTTESSEHNHFALTADFIQHTGQHIFLTGKAGTGKTTFLKHIKETSGKNMVVIAPTGVAAINAGGVTMHSFFQLPMGCFIPGSFRGSFQSQNQVTDKHHLLRNLRYSSEKIALMRRLELLVIDEVSMLRADWLDAIDILLRHVRRKQYEAFGGVQLLFIGDLYQLPPVANEQDWQLLRDYYGTPFFFSAQVIKQAHPLCIELKKVFRQSDEVFIHLLNRVRNNEVSDADLQRLHQLYQPNFKPKPEDHFITLTTHNYKADEINSVELKRLPGKEFIAKATLSGEFPERVFPVEQSLVLKQGAQIMFIKNDVRDKKYFNGKIGVLEKMEHDGEEEFITVRFPENNEVIKVRKETWRNIRYSFNEKENKIDEEELGAFTQYPIRLAWAVTIHKSQGLTFKKAVIDAGAAFAAGQVYVALSRCVSLEGMVLRSPIRREVIKTDEAIVAYMQEQPDVQQLTSSLTKEKEIYAIKTTMELFNLQPLAEHINSFIEFMGLRKIEEKQKIIGGLQTIHAAILVLHDVAEKFQVQLKGITAEGLPEHVAAQLQERVAKAKIYFGREMDEKIIAPLEQLNKELQKMNKVRKVLTTMKEVMDYFENFALRFRFKERKNEPVCYPVAASGSGAEEENAAMSTGLLEQLKDYRKQLSAEENLPPFRICNDVTLQEIAMFLPQSLNDMAFIKGMGDFTLNKYGEQFLSLVQDFCNAHELEGRMHLRKEKVKKSRNKSRGNSNVPVNKQDQAAGVNSKLQSFQLFQSGKSIAEIAAIRSLSAGTIETHLVHYVKTGELEVMRLVPAEKIQLISDAAAKVAEPGLTPVKILLGDNVSYGEIKFVLASMKNETKESAIT